MMYQTQAFFHDPAIGVYGDCYRTAIACVIDMERDAVPHFFHEIDKKGGEDPADWSDRVYAALVEWLREKGWEIYRVAYSTEAFPTLRDLLDYHRSRYERGLWLLTGESRSGCNHVVVCRGGTILWDPSINKSGIIGPCLEGHWEVEILVPIHFE